VFSFNDGQAHLYARNTNIQLLSWYNNTVPTLQHFIFIKDTEKLCFVEKGGRTRIFNLITQQFPAADFSLPINTTNVLSSPDGSCIVAFVKEKLGDNNPIEDGTDENSDIDSVISTNEEQNDPIKDDDIKEICRAYVYFCTGSNSNTKGL